MADTVHDILKRLPHFVTLDDEVVGTIEQSSARLHFDKGDKIFTQGAPAEAFFTVVEGRVKIVREDTSGIPRTLHLLGPGRTFAEAAVLNMKVYPASAISLNSKTELLRIDGSTFLSVLESEPALVRAMMSSLTVWLARLTDRVEELSLPSVTSRLARYLVTLPASSRGDTLVVTLPFSKKELAAHLITVPETLSRLLSKLTKDGVIDVHGKEITLRDADRLFDLASDARQVSHH